MRGNRKLSKIGKSIIINYMLTSTQKKILEVLKGKRRHGDIGIIATTTGLNRFYVGECLNPEAAKTYNETIVAAAKDLIAERKRKLQKTYDVVRSL
jgi:hypothetical protein